jgi:hypothetical protein
MTFCADGWRVGIHLEALEQLAIIGRPDGAIGYEEAMLGREAVDLGRLRLAFQALLERHVGDGESAQVGDRFAQHQLAIRVDALSG